MNKTAIKNFAVAARKTLIELVKIRAARFGILPDEKPDSSLSNYKGYLFSKIENEQRLDLIKQIEAKSYDQVMENVAYTWFNRFCALRFMEVNGYLPSAVRVFSDENEEFKPEILSQALDLDFEWLDQKEIRAYKEKIDDEGLFKYLIVAQCNALNELLPGMFQRIGHYTELLFPDYQLKEGSVVWGLVKSIDVDDWKDQVQIIGWLYQYYIYEIHKKVVDPLHGKVIKKEEIPAATQLFTTDWVVRYIVDNTVGRYWLERNPQSRIIDSLDYFVTPSKDSLPFVNENINPQDLTVFDPCVGSGHMLVYAFDVLMNVYRETGYSDTEAALEIVKNNLYGLDIDDRAAQLAYFAVMMKGRQYDRRFLKRGVQPHIYSIKETESIENEVFESFTKLRSDYSHDIEIIKTQLENAKEWGSLIQLPNIDLERILDTFEITEERFADLRTMLKAAALLRKKYCAVVTNPPYLNKYDTELKDFVVGNYKDFSSDLFAAVVYRCFDFCKENGYSGFMSPFVWMFIKSYEKLRKYILSEKQIVTLIQMEYSAFEEATVPLCSYVLKNGRSRSNGLFFRLSDFKGGMEVQKRKFLEANRNKDCGYFYETSQENFSKIPGAPIAYWASENLLNSFKSNNSLGKIARPRIGQNTGDNDRFLRRWYEVDKNLITFGLKHEELIKVSYKWLPYNKGGEFRRWYGNQEYLINWENDGEEIKKFAVIRNHGKHWSRYIQNIENMCKPGITWSFVTSSSFSVRYLPTGFICDVAGSAIFPDETVILELTALCNSKIATAVLKLLNPTINMQASNVANIPVNPIILENTTIKTISRKSISLSKKDWDSFETSWDFNNHPLLGQGLNNLAQAYSLWENECFERFTQLKTNEESLNKIFLEIYGLQDELTPEVDDKDVTVRKADKEREVKSLISYSVGCMFGRYSLDKPGLIYAGGEWNPSQYKKFSVDPDNIIPITEEADFEDDVVKRFEEFLIAVYGKETLEENLQFVADALGGKGTSRDVIRNYFLNGFFDNHKTVYQKRPIYWLLDSGKNNGFKGLIYLHRYDADLLSRVRTDYLHPQQGRYAARVQELDRRIAKAQGAEKVRLQKERTKAFEQEEELRVFEEKIHHLADQRIELDLDDGVKVNYAKLQDVLAKIK